MASTFKFHSQVGEVVPFSAQYTFPSQSTKITKQTVKLPAKNGSEFKAGSIIRIEFPADEYLNVLNSYLVFDATLNKGSASRMQWQRGGAQNAIKRLRILYGSLVIEDIQEYKTLVRMLTEASIPQDYRQSSGGILDGMSANVNTEPGATEWAAVGYDERQPTGFARTGTESGINLDSAGTLAGDDAYDNATITLTHKTYTVSGALKNVVTETRKVITSVTNTITNSGVTLLVDAPWDQVPYDYSATAGTPRTYYRIDFPGTNAPVISEGEVARDIAGAGLKRTYCLNLLSGLLTQKKLVPLKWMAAQLAIEITVADIGESCLFDNATDTSLVVNDPMFVAEMMSFDSTYDTAFYMGLESGGVPLKFSTFHYHSFNINGSSNTVQVHERARSIKAAYAVIRDPNARFGLKDSDKFYHAAGQEYDTNGSIKDTTRTVAPITEFQWRVGGRYYPSQPVRCTYGAGEAYVELLKALNQFGDYTMSNAINIYNWSTYGSGASYGDKFIIACEFENTDIAPMEINGINGEEQSDLALTMKFGAAIPTTVQRTLDVFVHYDCILIVRAGNLCEVIL